MKNSLIKIFLLAILILTFHFAAFGQKKKPVNIIPILWENKPLHFGFSIGFNAMDFKITPKLSEYQADSLYPEVSILNPGINIQVISGYRPNEFLELRFLPGVSFGQRNVRYYKNKVLVNEQQRLESSFLEFPVLLKYKGMRMNNVRPFLICGLNYRYDLAAKKEFDDDRPVYLRLKRSDLYYEAGTGLDFYLTYFKLSVELKMSNGLRNILVSERAPGHAEYRDAIDKMKSQIWVLSFHFE